MPQMSLLEIFKETDGEGNLISPRPIHTLVVPPEQMIILMEKILRAKRFENPLIVISIDQSMKEDVESYLRMDVRFKEHIYEKDELEG